MALHNCCRLSSSENWCMRWGYCLTRVHLCYIYYALQCLFHYYMCLWKRALTVCVIGYLTIPTTVTRPVECSYYSTQVHCLHQVATGTVISLLPEPCSCASSQANTWWFEWANAFISKNFTNRIIMCRRDATHVSLYKALWQSRSFISIIFMPCDCYIERARVMGRRQVLDLGGL